MFIVADVLARWQRKNNKEVYFPIAFHYSGSTVYDVVKNLRIIFSTPRRELTGSQKKLLTFYEKFYKTPAWVLRKINTPLFLLDYYSQEILYELRSLNISCDYKNFYTTKSEEFSNFVKIIFRFYKEKEKVIINSSSKRALDYNNSEWKDQVKKTINNTVFIQEFQRKNILGAIDNVKNNWTYEKNKGFGVKYNGCLIDPMFDSEMLTIYDLYWRAKNKLGNKATGSKEYFEKLFFTLKTGINESGDDSINEIMNWLPTDMFVIEEHLKNWIVKKFYSEDLFLAPEFKTKSYFVLGMAILNGKRMSASKGHAILTKDLIEDYGPINTRLTILLTGGHPSKTYNYIRNLPQQAKKLIEEFKSYYIYLLTTSKGISKSKSRNSDEISSLEFELDNNLQKGYYKQAVIDLMSRIPKQFRNSDRKLSRCLLKLYDDYLPILMPGLAKELKYGKL